MKGVLIGFLDRMFTATYYMENSDMPGSITLNKM